jgi:putative membrane protein
MTPQEKTFDLGYERTRMAADRTLMAWIRTSVSMISFGFTIYKFFQYLRESDVLTRELPHFGARNLGLALVAIGTFLMGIALVEHIIYMRSLSGWMNQKFSISLTADRRTVHLGARPAGAAQPALERRADLRLNSLRTGRSPSRMEASRGRPCRRSRYYWTGP